MHISIHKFLGLPLLGLLACQSYARQQDKRPNILFCIMDDASHYMGAYGDEWMDTPAFDRIAEEGILFTNAYTPNAKCAPSRAALITGRNSWQLEQAANHVANFPGKFKTFPEVLRENGYLTAKTGKGWAPGDPGKIDGQPRLLIGESIENNRKTPPANGISRKDYAANFEDFLRANSGNKPWFFWYGAHEPHRRYEYGTGKNVGGKNLDDIPEVPLFWPDNEIVRNDMLDYSLEVEHADNHLGRMLESLEKRDLLNNTIVVMTSDHGMPFPRCKAQSYEYSNHVPLAIMWPKGIKNPGRKVKDMVSFIDFAPTFLEVAGIPYQESGMHSSPGKSLTDIFYSGKDEQVNPERDYLLIGKERHDYSRPDNQGFPIRGMVTDNYLYLYNYDISLWPAGNPEIGYLDCDGSPTKTLILNLFRKDQDKRYWQWSFGKREAHEELFKISTDPYCINNLASDPEFFETKQKMRKQMERDLKAQNDPRMDGNGDIFNSYGYSKEKGWNYYERFMKGEFTIEDTPWVNPGDQEKQSLD